MILQVNHLVKKIDQKPIVNDVSFSIETNQIISLIGHSGAGKTTILRMLNGIVSITDGTIQFNDIKLTNQNKLTNNDIEKLHKNITLVFQNFNLFPHLNVLQNLTLALTLQNKKQKLEIIQKAKRWLKILKLEDKEVQYPYQLSGGEKQRVAIARACMLNPKIICFDEPTSALDPHLVNEVSDIIKRLKKEALTILIVTHDMNFAKKVSDRMITIEKGKIISDQPNPV